MRSLSLPLLLFCLSSLIALPCALCELSVPSIRPHFSFASGPDDGSLSAPLPHSLRVSDAALPWLLMAPTVVHSSSAWLSSADGTLVLLSSSNGTDPSGPLGPHVWYEWEWADYRDAARQVMLVTNAQLYGDFIIFNQYFPLTLVNTSVDAEQGDSGKGKGKGKGKGRESVCSSWPSFYLDTEGDNATIYKGYFDLAGAFMTAGSYGVFDTAAQSALTSGDQSGPLILFDEDIQMASIFTPLSSFMATSIEYSNGTMRTGVFGSATSIPAGHDLSSIIVFAASGVDAAIKRWGDIMRTTYNKPLNWGQSDANVQYLGYSTDRGAYLWYNSDDYQTSIVDVKAYSLDAGIPYQWLEIDSYWYYKVGNGWYGVGLKNWTAIESYFPSGLPLLREKTQWPMTAHDRFYSPLTDYAQQNGGKYRFIVEEAAALPDDDAFFPDLFLNASMLGIDVNLQDWLYVQYDDMDYLHAHVNTGRQWLSRMNDGALQNAFHVVYCMPYPRMVLQSIEFLSVTQIRGSDDHLPSNNSSFLLGETCQILHALGVACLKDNFLTHSHQQLPGNPAYPLAVENAPEFEAAMATLGMGPVTPGDQVGKTNVQMLARAHRPDGLILKPDTPLFSLNDVYRARSFKSMAPNALWGMGVHGVTALHDTTRAESDEYRVILTANLTRPYTLSYQALGLNASSSSVPSQFIIYTYSPRPLHNGQLITSFSAASPVVLPPCSAIDFILYYLSPVVANASLVLIGEPGKWAHISSQRIASYHVAQQSVTLGLLGVPQERVWMQFFLTQSAAIAQSACVIGEAGNATMIATVEGNRLLTQCV